MGGGELRERERKRERERATTAKCNCVDLGALTSVVAVLLFFLNIFALTRKCKRAHSIAHYTHTLYGD